MNSINYLFESNFVFAWPNSLEFWEKTDKLVVEVSLSSFHSGWLNILLFS